MKKYAVNCSRKWVEAEQLILLYGTGAIHQVSEHRLCGINNPGHYKAI